MRIRKKKCRSALADPQKKVRNRSSESPEKSADPLMWIRRKSANPLKQIHRKKCRPTHADPLKNADLLEWIRSKKVRTRSCRSAEKMQIRWCGFAADPLKWIHSMWCRIARVNPLKNMQTRSSRSARPRADPLRSGVICIC